MEFSTPEISLLREIQRDASLSLAELSERVGMAQSTVWRKIQDFEKAGLIRGRVTLLDPKLAGCGLCVLAQVRLQRHNQDAVDGFIDMVRAHPEIQECFAVSGTADYVLKVRVPDMESYEAFMSENLLRSDLVANVISNFVMKEIKHTTSLPL